MKIVNFIKNTPFIFTLLIIILVSISNQKQSSRLKILIWNTPSLPLGTYLGVSAATGYIISYIATSNLAKLYKKNSKKEIKYKFEDQLEETNQNQEAYNDLDLQKIFLEMNEMIKGEKHKPLI